MTTDLSELLQVIDQNYPCGMLLDDPEYWSEPKAARRRAAAGNELSQALAAAFGDLATRYPSRQVWNHTVLLHDPAYRIRIPLQTDEHYPAVFVCFSVLGPYWIAYASLAPDDPRKSDDSGHWSISLTPAEAAEASTFVDWLQKRTGLGLLEVPADQALQLVPDIYAGNLLAGEARVIDLVFTTDRW